MKKERLRKLKIKEDEFNKNAALIPESDPNVAIINDKIIQVKEEVEKVSQERANLSGEFKRVADLRVHTFL